MNLPPSFLYPLLVSLLPGIGPQRYQQLHETYRHAEQVLQQPPKHLSLPSKAYDALKQHQRCQNSSKLMLKALQLIEACQSCQGKIISLECPDYPPLLKAINAPPPILFYRGNLQALALPQLALVGTRHASGQGIRNATAFAQHLNNSGFVITSGLALGIDSAAHLGALSTTNATTTIAVMGTGVDRIYPKQHTALAQQILDQGGGLLSEFPPKTAPKAHHFPQRNRIISGISMGTLVVEAAIKSGSLITAQYALEQNRTVFAIPGSIHHPQSKGCHHLIKQGAVLVETSDDIVAHLGGELSTFEQQTTTNAPMLPPRLDALLTQLDYAPQTIDALVEQTQLPLSQLMESLNQLELDGWVQRSAWGYERINKELSD